MAQLNTKSMASCAMPDHAIVLAAGKHSVPKYQLTRWLIRLNFSDYQIHSYYLYMLMNTALNYNSVNNVALLYVVTSTMKFMVVTLGCINEDPATEIRRHIFIGSKASWEVIPKGVPQFEEHEPEDT